MPRGSPLIHSWLVSLGLANDGPSTIATANLWPRSAVAEQLQRIELSLLGELAFRMPLKTQETILVWTASCVSSCRMPRPCAATPRLVVIAIDLLPEGLRIECLGSTGDAGNDRKRNKGGQDGLHDHSPLTCLIGVASAFGPIRSDCGRPARRTPWCPLRWQYRRRQRLPKVQPGRTGWSS